MQQKFKAAIFDLDGTLAYTFGDLVVSINLMLTQYGYPTREKADMISYISCCERDWVKFSLPEELQQDNGVIDHCQATYTAIYNEHYLDTTVLYPGLETLLKRMKEAGIRLAVNTNKYQEHAQAIIDKLTPGIFEVLKGDGQYPSKPDPAGALEIAAYYGIAPSEICYIGDSDIDMRTAANAGMFAIGVTWGYRSAQVLTENGAKVLVDDADALAKCFF